MNQSMRKFEINSTGQLVQTNSTIAFCSDERRRCKGKQVFNRALDQAPIPNLLFWLACADDEELRREVESLLAAY